MGVLDWLRGREYNRPLGDAVDSATLGQFTRDIEDARKYSVPVPPVYVGDAVTIQDELQISGYVFADDEIRAILLSLDDDEGGGY